MSLPAKAWATVNQAFAVSPMVFKSRSSGWRRWVTNRLKSSAGPRIESDASGDPNSKVRRSGRNRLRLPVHKRPGWPEDRIQRRRCLRLRGQSLHLSKPDAGNSRIHIEYSPPRSTQAGYSRSKDKWSTNQSCGTLAKLSYAPGSHQFKTR